MYNAGKDMLTYKAIVDFNWLGSLMKNRIVCNFYGTSIISIEWSGTKNKKIKVVKELLKPNHLTTCRRHRYVFSFS